MCVCLVFTLSSCVWSCFRWFHFIHFLSLNHRQLTIIRDHQCRTSFSCYFWWLVVKFGMIRELQSCHSKIYLSYGYQPYFFISIWSHNPIIVSLWSTIVITTSPFRCQSKFNSVESGYDWSECVSIFSTYVRTR